MAMVGMEKPCKKRETLHRWPSAFFFFLLDSWKKLLQAIFGSQKTKQVTNGDQLLLLFC